MLFLSGHTHVGTGTERVSPPRRVVVIPRDPSCIVPVSLTRESQVIKGFPDGDFSVIIHDPPARALCKTTDVYGSAFYEQMARVLKPGGSLFHYVGNPSSA